MDFQTLMQQDKAYIAGSYGRFPVDIASGKGAVCTDLGGKRYIDLGAGIGVNTLGYSDWGWAAVVAAQAGKLSHTSNLYYTQPCAALAQRLCQRTGSKKVFFSNSGAEANECAIKAARKYSHDKYGDGRYEIITLKNSFHGRTVTTLAATGQESFHQHFMPFTPGFVSVEAENWDGLQQALSGRTCAIMLELVQGEGGVIPLSQGYVTAVAELCRAYDLLLLVDEVQTGIGRTGRLLAAEHYGLKPDIVTLAKGLGGGLPIGATLFYEKAQGVLCPGDHGSTYGGNPIACAGAVYILDRVDEALLAEVSQKGAWLREQLAALPGVGAISGLGLMLGLTVAPLNARGLAEKCAQRGLLVLTAKDKLRLLPPLCITYQELAQALEILKQVLEEEQNP